MNGRLFNLACVLAPVFALAALYQCVRALRQGKRLPPAARCLGGLVLSLGLLAAGRWGLPRLGLAWRNLPALLLSAVFLISGLGCVVLTAGTVLKQEVPEERFGGQLAIQIVTLLAAGLVCFYGVVYGGIFAVLAFGDRERVLDHQGQRLVEVERGWLDTSYVYYQYHGPLIRGNEIIISQPYAPLDGNG